MKLGKRIILAGKAASGKDFFREYLVNKGYLASISHTTRPPRHGEVNGDHYNFVEEKEFQMMIHKELFHEHKMFNTWRYGTTKHMFFTSDVFIFTPSGIESLDREDLDDSVVVFFDIDTETRIERMEKRIDADNIERRLAADAIDFMDFDMFDIRVKNPGFDPERLLKTIISYIASC
jgi:guanylate kinase